MHPLTVTDLNSDPFLNDIIPHIKYCAEDVYKNPWILKKRKMDTYELLFVSSGTGIITIDKRQYNVKPNDLILLNLGKYHSGYSCSLPFSFYCIHFNLYVSKSSNSLSVQKNESDDSYRRVHGKYFLGSPPLTPVKYYKATLDFPDILTVKDRAYFCLLFRRIISETEQQEKGYPVILKSLFMELLLKMARPAQDTSAKNHNPTEIQEIIHYISKNYMNRIQLSDLAACVHLHPAYISKLFKKHTGQTISGFIITYRISEAKKLLLDTSRKIEDIAYSIGFYDLHHFSKIFKKQEGISPVKFRQAADIQRGSDW